MEACHYMGTWGQTLISTQLPKSTESKDPSLQ